MEARNVLNQINDRTALEKYRGTMQPELFSIASKRLDTDISISIHRLTAAVADLAPANEMKSKLMDISSIMLMQKRKIIMNKHE